MDHVVTYKRVPIASLHEDPANARKHGPENLAAIRASLREFGQVEPLVVQRSSGKVIGGNGRLVVMRELGWAEADVAEVDLCDMKAACLGVVLNRSGELAEWDKEALEAVLREVQTANEELNKALDDLAAAEGIVAPDFEPGGEGEQGQIDEKVKAKCPRCGHEF